MVKLKERIFQRVPSLRDRRSKMRVRLRGLRYKVDRFGAYVLKAQSKFLIPFREVTIMPYSTFSGDGFATQHHVDFLENKKFQSAFHLAFDDVPQWMNSKTYRDIIWRAHICCWGADHALNLDGDFVELGVWYGLLPRTVCELFKDDARFANRPYFLVDSWGQTTGSHPNPDYHPDIYQEVERRFAAFPNLKLVRGLVPDVLPEVTPLNPHAMGADVGIAFLTIDMNGHLAERAALEFYYERLVPGAFVYFDDYGWGYEGLVETVNDFLRDKPETLLHFPSGQSIFLKV